MRIAMVSEHASPLAALGGVDAGGQNVHVAALAQAVARRGAQVVVHTRRDDPDLPARVQMAPGVVVHHVDAGPPYPVPKDDLPPYMDAFAADLSRVWRRWRPDVAHAHFWMSGMAAVDAGRPLGIPVVQTFHALGVVKRRHQGERDTSPPQRREVERRLLAEVDRVVATCTDEVFELVRLGADVRIDGHHAVVRGRERLSSAPVVATDIRAGAGLVLAGLVSDGVTEVQDVHHVDRGYPDFVEQLRGLVAHIERVQRAG